MFKNISVLCGPNSHERNLPVNAVVLTFPKKGFNHHLHKEEGGRETDV